MTRKRGSTSSTPMEPSKRPKDVLDLGKRLVEELELQKTCQTLAKWMAHHLAELILTAEKETDPAPKLAAQQQCCELIERLWAQRANLPGGAKPLGRLDDALKALQAMQADQAKFPVMVRRAADQIENPWLEFARDSYAADKRMACIAYLTGVLDAEFAKEKRWVEESEEHLSEKEKKLIRLLDDWLGSKVDWLTREDRAPVSSLLPEERTQTILRELEQSLQKQTEAFQRLKGRVADPPEQNAQS